MSMSDFTGGTGGTNNGTPMGPGNGGSIPGNNSQGGGMPPFDPNDPSLNMIGLGGPIDVNEMLINYNVEFKSASPVLFRDSVVQQTLAVLIGKNKPNTLLVGPAGVGKTKIVEDIAYRLANNDPIIPDKIKGFTIYELPLSNVVAGSSLVGQVEEKIKAVVDFATNPANKAILFIDEIHQLVKNDSPTYQKIAQILKPALARGKMKVIGATTTQEARHLNDDPAFNRRFSKIIVDELNKDQTIEILKTSKLSFLKHYNYQIALDDQTFTTIVDLAERYKTAGSHRPDNAITLLDRAIGDAIVSRRKQEVILSADPTKAAMLQALKSIKPIPVTEKQIRQTAIKLATGNNKPETLNVDELRQALNAIKGQDQIIEKLILELRKHELNIAPSEQPMTMLFIGPSGVGKTEVTKIIAKTTTGCNPIILNMTEYNSPASVNRILGSWAGYAGSESNSELPFDSLESNPYQIILLDEFEKCNPAVQKLFMQVFDEGILKTNRGTTIDFSRSIIIATTNAGYTVRSNQIGFGKDKTTNETDIRTLSKSFDIALLNRFKQKITFSEIDKDTYREILVAKYEALLTQIKTTKHRVNLPDTIPDAALDQMVEDTYVPEFGARPARKAVEDFIYAQLL